MQYVPHSGYHWDRSSPRFFEGWYFRITLPEISESFAFTYSIEDPQGGTACSGGAVQVFAPQKGEQKGYLCRSLPDVNQFWASYQELALGHWGKTNLTKTPGYLHPEIFRQTIEQGYQITPSFHQGKVYDPGSQNSAEWEYKIAPIYGWGNVDEPQQATAGWLSYFPFSEPLWQVLLAHGLATGWIEWNGERYEFSQVPIYGEKNWGRAFPTKWFWMQCNSFVGEENLSFTAVGGLREVFNQTESVGLMGVHYQGKFYEFFTPHCQVYWEVYPWGRWYISIRNFYYELQIVGTTDLPPVPLRAPTEQGFIFLCQETMKGNLSLVLRKRGGGESAVIVQAESSLAALEVGGNPWDQPWVWAN